MTSRSLRFVPLAALLLLALGCPKDDKNTSPTPVPTSSAQPAGTVEGLATQASPAGTVEGLATPAPTTATKGAWRVLYTWSGGLSIYHHYSLEIDGSGDQAKVVFKVKPMRQDEVRVDDVLDAAEVAELQGLFAQVKFDEVTTAQRKVRVMDIGQTTITREMDGKKKEVMENPAQQATTDIKPLRSWLDARVKMYLEKSGVAPKKNK